MGHVIRPASSVVRLIAWPCQQATGKLVGDQNSRCNSASSVVTMIHRMKAIIAKRNVCSVARYSKDRKTLVGRLSMR